MKDALQSLIRIESRRLLTLLDRNSLGSTQGLFDRNYWHFKTADFPSSAKQMGMAALAKLYKYDPSFAQPMVLRWIEKSILATAAIQHRDGTFDEWYPNERGWAGPTGYILNACCDTYLIVGHQLSSKYQQVLLQTIDRAAGALVRGGEGHVLTNHTAMAWLALIQARHILETPKFNGAIERFKAEIIGSFHHDEGWSLEYDGADPGYQTGTLSFLSKGLRLHADPELHAVARASLPFISHFAYPDGTFGGAVGSRHTVNVFFAGLVAFSTEPIGKALCDHLASGLAKGRIVLPSDLDDHYYIYRLNELLDAFIVSLDATPSATSAPLPFHCEHECFFKKAGIITRRAAGIYSVVSLSRGGALQAWNCDTGKKIAHDNGVILISGGRDYSSLWQGAFEFRFENGIATVKGPLYRVTQKTFGPVTGALFRIVSRFFAFHMTSARWLKDFIRRVLIMNPRNDAFGFSRKIVFKDDSLQVDTQIVSPHEPDQVLIGGEFWTRYVPQSRHFTILDTDETARPTTLPSPERIVSYSATYRA